MGSKTMECPTDSCEYRITVVETGGVWRDILCHECGSELVAADDQRSVTRCWDDEAQKSYYTLDR